MDVEKEGHAADGREDDGEDELPPTTRLSRVRKYFDMDVTTNHADLLMLLCCLVTGFVDSTLYNGELHPGVHRGSY